MRVLALESAGARCSVALVQDGVAVAHAAQEAARGHATLLPVLVQQVLGEAPIDGVAVGVGPGGFTGLRAGIALAAGIAQGRGVPLWGVSTGAALAALEPPPAGWECWIATDNKRGRIFLERPGLAPETLDETSLPAPTAPVLLLGDAAPRAAARLLARGGARVMLGQGRIADALGVARAEARLPPEPLYVDAPATT